LDDEYRHIIDITACQEPRSPVKIARPYDYTSFDFSTWVLVSNPKDFDAFWLYESDV